MAKKLLYTKTCVDCHKVFRTDNEKATCCEKCMSFRKPRKVTVRKKKAARLSINAILRIEKIYNTVNKTLKHYGEIVRIIENTEADRCVCCGEIIPEGRMVCLLCQSKAKGGCK